jgi:spoIIIJ-associated protein
VEWVETTGRSIDEAKDLALDQLGVDEQEAEFEILEEPTKGLFGRTRGEARVRARIQPKAPPPKVERRERRRTSAKKSGSRQNGAADAGAAETTTTADATTAVVTDEPAPARTRGRGRANPAGTDTADAVPAAGTDAPAAEAPPARSSRGSGRGSKRSPAAGREPSPAPERSDMSTTDVTVQEQAEIVREFLEGLVAAFGVDGTLEQEQIDEDTIEVKVVGDDLGLLIGPKGNTLVAVQELARTVVQRQASGTHHGRVRIDVGGYRQRRREALERFTTQVAEQVKESGLQKALEPMVASDRKVVHDTVNAIDGVRTLSEGEEPRRRVVIAPE